MEIYTFKIHDVKASAQYSGNSFIVLKGSAAVGDDGLGESFLYRNENEGRRKLRAKLLQEGKLIISGHNLTFTEDVKFNSPSQAATIIAGSNQDGPKVFGLPKVTTINYEFYEIDNESAVEGYKKDQVILSTHRNKELSKLRKEKDDFTCECCGFRLEVDGKFIIECHHLTPLASTGEVETTIESLVSLCPTCHRIAHMRKPPYQIEEIQNFMESTLN